MALYRISQNAISHYEFVIVSNPSNFAIFLVFLPLCFVLILRCHIGILSLSSAVPLHLAR